MRAWQIGFLLLAAAAASPPAGAADVARAPFGKTPSGETVEAITLTNARGMSARIISWGAAIQSVLVPDRHEQLADVALGYPSMEGYLAKSEYFGATVGRVANRIAKGRFTLDGKGYQTPVNNGPNALHGGTQGFDKVNWKVVEAKDGPTASVTLRYVSPHMDQGYPGTLTATATYTLDESNTLAVEYRATTDRPTLVNLSNHAYWNLAGEGSAEGAMGHLLTIPADHYSPTDATAIPTGEFRPVQGTAFDFRRPTAVGARVRDASDPQIVYGKGYDHNWAIARVVAKAPRLLARVEEPSSGRVMHVLSNQPGLQFYSGNFLDAVIAGKAGKLYRQGDALVLEPQMFPDTPNRPEFGSVRLDPGETYRNQILFRFSTDAGR
jgi:aldose 1-epimerase